MSGTITEQDDLRAALNARLLAVWPGRAPLPQSMPIDRMQGYIERLEAAAADVKSRGGLHARWAADNAMFGTLRRDGT